MEKQTRIVLRIILGLIIIILLGFFIPAHAEAPIMTEIEAKEVKLTDWLTRLGNCESGGKWTALNKSDGGSRSVGLLQFKDSTFINYSKKYKLGFKPEDIWNGTKQMQVALLMLKENINNQNQWFNCAKRIGRL